MEGSSTCRGEDGVGGWIEGARGWPSGPDDVGRAGCSARDPDTTATARRRTDASWVVVVVDGADSKALHTGMHGRARSFPLLLSHMVGYPTRRSAAQCSPSGGTYSERERHCGIYTATPRLAPMPRPRRCIPAHPTPSGARLQADDSIPQ